MKFSDCANEHPAKVAVELNAKNGGTHKEVSYGVSLLTGEGRAFVLIKNIRKDNVSLYLHNTTVETAKKQLLSLVERVKLDKKGYESARLCKITATDLSIELLESLKDVCLSGKEERKVLRKAKKTGKVVAIKQEEDSTKESSRTVAS